MSLNSATPQNVDQFSRLMADVFDQKQIISVPTGFQAFFGRPETGAQTLFSPNANMVDIDIIKGNERMSALIPRGMVSKPLGSLRKGLNAERFSTFARKFPLAEEEGDISADQLLFRTAGELPTSSKDRFQRMRHLALKLHEESIRKIVRMFEYLAAQSVLSGKQDAIIGTTDANLQYDFMRLATHIITVDTAWNDTTPTILADIDGACAKLEQNGHVNPNFMGIGDSAMDDFLSDTTIQNLADNRRFELVQIGMDTPPEFARFIASGWIFRGVLQTPKGRKLYLFNYNKTYDNSSGVATRLLPSDKAFITSTDARCDRYFGPPENLPMIPMRQQLYQELFGFNPASPPMPQRILGDGSIIDPAMFYCDGYVSGNWKSVTIRTQSAPIFATTQTDAFVTLAGLHT